MIPVYECGVCKKQHEKSSYNVKTRDEIISNEDFKIRDKIMQMY